MLPPTADFKFKESEDLSAEPDVWHPLCGKKAASLNYHYFF
jgi:hypothetical protein